MSPTTNAIEPRLALWGAFDVAELADHLAPLIFAHEIQRRFEHSEMRAFSPLGYLHPLPFDSGHLVEPLGEWSPERLTELIREIDLVAIGNGEIIRTDDDAYSQLYDTSVEEARRLQPSRFFIEGLGPALEESHLVAWHAVGVPFELDEHSATRVRTAARTKAYVAVHNELSRERLLRAGVEREIAVVPDIAFLAGRIFTEDVLERRLAYLRGIEAYPPSERPIVVQGSRALLSSVDEIAAVLATVTTESEGVPIVLLETGAHGDRGFTDALAARLAGAVYRMPKSPIVSDIVTAIAHARCFIGDSLTASAIAFAHGLPTSVLDLSHASPARAEFAALIRSEDVLVRAHADLLPALRRTLAGRHRTDGFGEIASRVDAHFDALAALAERAAQTRSDERHAGSEFSRNTAASQSRDESTTLRRAFNARGRRLVEQRLRLADQLEQREEEVRARERQIDEKNAEIERLEERIEHLEAVVQSLLDSKWFRYTAPLRAIARILRPSA